VSDISHTMPHIYVAAPKSAENACSESRGTVEYSKWRGALARLKETWPHSFARFRPGSSTWFFRDSGYSVELECSLNKMAVAQLGYYSTFFNGINVRLGTMIDCQEQCCYPKTKATIKRTSKCVAS